MQKKCGASSHFFEMKMQRNAFCKLSIFMLKMGVYALDVQWEGPPKVDRMVQRLPCPSYP